MPQNLAFSRPLDYLVTLMESSASHREVTPEWTVEALVAIKKLSAFPVLLRLFFGQFRAAFGYRG